MTPVRIVQQTTQTSPNARPSLQAGSVVTARVVQNAGGGNYVISLGGQMISVRSETPLQQGAVFSARIDVRGEQVVLSLVGQGETKPLVTQFNSAAVQGNMDTNLAQLLASLGLPAEAESFRLLQFAQAMGMKIDSRQLRKALAAAKQNGEGGAETALVLDEKGLDASGEAIRAVADGMSGKGQSGGRRDESGDSTRMDADGRGWDADGGDAGAGDCDDGAGDCGDDVDGVRGERAEGERLGDSTRMDADGRGWDADGGDGASDCDDDCDGVKRFFGEVDEAAERQRVGALTVFNSLRGGDEASDGARWVLLPFEWRDDYRGVIRILPEKNQKKLRQIIINAKNLHTSWNFVVYCKQGKIDSVRFSRFPLIGDGTKLAEELKKILLPSFGSLRSVGYGAELEDWCAQDVSVGTVGGLV